MRMTKKLVDASYYVKIVGKSHEEVYAQMEDLGYVWNAKIRAWVGAKIRAKADSNPPKGGMIKIRIEGTRADVAQAVREIKDAREWYVSTESRPYENRGDFNVRVYLELKKVAW